LNVWTEADAASGSLPKPWAHITTSTRFVCAPFVVVFMKLGSRANQE